MGSDMWPRICNWCCLDPPTGSSWPSISRRNAQKLIFMRSQGLQVRPEGGKRWDLCPNFLHRQGPPLPLFFPLAWLPELPQAKWLMPLGTCPTPASPWAGRMPRYFTVQSAFIWCVPLRVSSGGAWSGGASRGSMQHQLQCGPHV